MPIVQCVPNFSEGRDLEKIEKIMIKIIEDYNLFKILLIIIFFCIKLINFHHLLISLLNFHRLYTEVLCGLFLDTFYCIP